MVLKMYLFCPFLEFWKLCCYQFWREDIFAEIKDTNNFISWKTR
jgi:hypothetical protein